MVIRSEQLERMDKALQERYHETLRKLLRTRFPELVCRLDDVELRDRISTAVPQARSYGLRTGEGILAYLGMALAAGPAFHTDPHICGFLARQGYDPDSKIRWMFEQVVAKLQLIAAQAPATHDSANRQT